MTRIELERMNRICVSLWAYAYEFKGDSIVSDGEFDKVCLSIDKSIKTGYTVTDKFFEEEFQPDTGQWIHAHPDLDKIAQLYKRLGYESRY